MRALSDAAVLPARDALIVGRSARFAAILRQVQRIAKAAKPVLIRGEAGSELEALARALHQHSPRSPGRFVAVRCSETDASTLASVLAQPDAGAVNGRGTFDTPPAGTVFLEGISDLPEDLQAELSRLLKAAASGRAAADGTSATSVRVVASTDIDLDRAVAKGKFRPDLLRSFSSHVLNVPPLRERREDIPDLARHYFHRFNVRAASGPKGFSELAVRAMEAHTWPGDVRELMNRVRCAIIMAEGEQLTPGDLGLESPVGPGLQQVLDEARAEAERGAISSTLQRNGRDVAVSARQLGMSRMSLYRLMVKHGLSPTH